MNPVLLLQFEVLLQVVHQNHTTEVPPSPAQIFYQLFADLHCVLPVKANTDDWQVLQDDVRIFFERAGEDAHLEVRLEALQELEEVRPKQKLAFGGTDCSVMNESLIEVEQKSVLGSGGMVQVGRWASLEELYTPANPILSD